MSVMDQIKQLSNDLKKLKETLSSQQSISVLQKLDLRELEALDPSMHTAGYCMILAAKAETLREPEFDLYFNVTSAFLCNCKAELATDDDARTITWSKLGEVCEKFAYVAIRLKRPGAAFGPLAAAIELVQCGSATTLTPAHTALVQVALKGRCYHAALPYIETPAITQCSKTTGCRPKEILLYLYYAGRVYLGTKEFSKACSVFSRALAMPVDCAHAVLWQCRQKLIFSSLLAYGNAPTEVQMWNTSVSHSFDKACGIYRSMLDAFSNYDISTFNTELAKLNETLTKNGNNGLARQCLVQLQRECVKRLAKVHSVAPLTQVQEEAGLGSVAAAEDLIVSMVHNQQLLAQISCRDGMVSFTERTHEYTSAESAQQLQQCLTRQFALLKGIQHLSADLEEEPQYIMATLSDDDKASAGADKDMEAAIQRSLQMQ